MEGNGVGLNYLWHTSLVIFPSVATVPWVLASQCSAADTWNAKPHATGNDSGRSLWCVEGRGSLGVGRPASVCYFLWRDWGSGGWLRIRWCQHWGKVLRVVGYDMNIFRRWKHTSVCGDKPVIAIYWRSLNTLIRNVCQLFHLKIFIVWSEDITFACTSLTDAQPLGIKHILQVFPLAHLWPPKGCRCEQSNITFFH